MQTYKGIDLCGTPFSTTLIVGSSGKPPRQPPLDGALVAWRSCLDTPFDFAIRGPLRHAHAGWGTAHDSAMNSVRHELRRPAMRMYASDTAQLTDEYGIQIGRWAQYEDLGKLPFDAMW